MIKKKNRPLVLISRFLFGHAFRPRPRNFFHKRFQKFSRKPKWRYPFYQLNNLTESKSALEIVPTKFKNSKVKLHITTWSIQLLHGRGGNQNHSAQLLRPLKITSNLETQDPHSETWIFLDRLRKKEKDEEQKSRKKDPVKHQAVFKKHQEMLDEDLLEEDDDQTVSMDCWKLSCYFVSSMLIVENT